MGWCGVWLGGVRQLATTLLSSFSNSNYFIDSCNITCNYTLSTLVNSCDTIYYVVIFSIKFQPCFWLLYHATWNYVVIFSIKFQLRCWLLSHNLQLRCRLLWHNLQLRSLLPSDSEENWAFYMSMWATTVGKSCEKNIAAEKNLFVIDAAWSALKSCIPKSLSSQSRDLLLYAKSRQWKYINRSANLQQKTIEVLKRIFWRKMSCFRLHKKKRWTWAVTVGKCENNPFSVAIFWMIFMKEIRVSPQCHA